MTRHLLALSLILLTAPAFAQDGAALYRRDCAACHDMGADRAPTRETLQAMAAERVLSADRKSTRLNSSHVSESRMPSSA